MLLKCAYILQQFERALKVAQIAEVKLGQVQLVDGCEQLALSFAAFVPIYNSFIANTRGLKPLQEYLDPDLMED